MENNCALMGYEPAPPSGIAVRSPHRPQAFTAGRSFAHAPTTPRPERRTYAEAGGPQSTDQIHVKRGGRGKQTSMIASRPGQRAPNGEEIHVSGAAPVANYSAKGERRALYNVALGISDSALQRRCREFQWDQIPGAIEDLAGETINRVGLCVDPIEPWQDAQAANLLPRKTHQSISTKARRASLDKARQCAVIINEVHP